MKRHEKATELFLNGYRCSQAVLEVFAEEYGMTTECARKISIAVSGGAGVGGACGAVAAAFLVNGLAQGFTAPGEPERFWPIIEDNVRFSKQFTALHGALNCRELIGLDIMTEAGKTAFREQDMKSKMCVSFVRDAVTILEAILPPHTPQQQTA